MTLGDLLSGMAPQVAQLVPPSMGAPSADAPVSLPPPAPSVPMPRDLSGQQQAAWLQALSRDGSGPVAPRWLQMLPALFAVGARLGGSPTTGTGALVGAQEANVLAEQQRAREAAREAQRIHLAQQSAAINERLAQEQRLREAEERRLAEARAKFVMDAKAQARKLTTQAEVEEFVTFADAMGTQSLGLRPGVLRQHITFTPPAVQERAAAQLQKIRARWKAEGRDLETLSGVMIPFDLMGNGEAKPVPYTQLLELAGEQVLTPDGKPYEPAKPRSLTFGQAFPQALGTVLADKPLPTTASGEPDYSRGLLDLQRAMRLTAPQRQQSRTDAQREARTDFEAAVLAGLPIDQLKGRFTSQFKPLGLNVNVEYARLRERLFGVGAKVTPESEREADALTPQDVINRGRAALTGQAPSSSRDVLLPAAGAAPRGTDPIVIRNPALRAAALKVLQGELQRRGAGPQVTDAQIDQFLSDPNNVRLLEQK